MFTRILSLTGALAILVAGFFLVVRPWYLHWGATFREQQQWLPGDQIIPGAAWQETHAITIAAPLTAVWPWVAQLGQDRGGFYSFDLLENLVGCEMPTRDALRPDKQAWMLGDRLWMYPPDKAGGVGFATLRAYIRGRALGFGTRYVGTSLNRPEDGSWSFVLLPVTPRTTRLVVRGRGAGGRSLLSRAFDRAVFEPVHFAMQRRMMIGIKQLAEGSSRQRLLNHAQVALWTATFGLFVLAAAMVIRRRNWARPLCGVIASGLLFEFLTLRQPPVFVGAFLLAAVVAVLWWPTSRPARRHRVTFPRAA